ncbi:alpha/beta fold hydrolase [Promethearchaeum syntrophicum]|uniref:Alpha/beta fold hydrolase n=1 Tax=Promethearchaeum syntrophicum TaxID=2594042 RepID=A0A5B9D986_9ARCH|nr:alpha/beta hydrolase [Candidatus Prometheoarchaeum syntrophicum]QEE15407.1 haloalkane dehalogenase [Candidatus Prometheoarchaeum syntrophicum]
MPTMKINDINIFYEIHGNGEPLLLIHGLGSSTQDWEYQIPQLSKQYKVITIDLRGHGKTSKANGPYSIRGFADDVAMFLEALNIKHTNILGLSMGTATGFELAINYPDLVKSLIAVNMSVKLSVKTFGERKQFFIRTLIVKLLGMKKMGEFLAPRLFPFPTQEELRKKVAIHWAENDKKSYLLAMNSLKNWSVEEELHKIKCPTIVIASDGDYTPVEAKEEYVKKIPNCKIAIIKNSHHAVPMEKPEEFNKLVLDFLNQI